MTDPLRRLTDTLHAQIPLSAAMGVRAARYDAEGLVLEIPLAPNHNHAATAFAGSLNALTTLAGWGLLWLLLDEAGLAASIVIQDSSIDYLRPVDADLIVARCAPPPPVELERFLSALRRRGLARVALNTTIGPESRPQVRFIGRYVARRDASAVGSRV